MRGSASSKTLCRELALPQMRNSEQVEIAAECLDSADTRGSSKSWLSFLACAGSCRGHTGLRRDAELILQYPVAVRAMSWGSR